MRVWLALLLSLAACEREADLWRNPQVGDRRLAVATYASDLVGADGRSHAGASLTWIVTEVLEASGDRITRARLTFLHDGHIFDGRLMGMMTGTFELAPAGAGLDIVKLGGTVTDRERAFLAQSRSLFDIEGTRSLRARRLKAGDRFRATPAEAAALGQGEMDSVDVVVETMDASNTELQLTLHKQGDEHGPTIRGRATMRVTASERTTDTTAELLLGDRVVGHVRSEVHVTTFHH